MWGGRAVNFELGLAADFITRCFVGEFRYELVSLSVNIGLTWRCLWRFNIASEKFLCRLGLLLLSLLGVVLLFVGLEQLVWVGASGDDHRCIGAASEDTFIMHDVLRVVFFPCCSAVWILVLLLLRHDPRMGGETALVLGL